MAKKKKDKKSKKADKKGSKAKKGMLARAAGAVAGAASDPIGSAKGAVQAATGGSAAVGALELGALAAAVTALLATTGGSGESGKPSLLGRLNEIIDERISKSQPARRQSSSRGKAGARPSGESAKTRATRKRAAAKSGSSQG